MADAERGKVIYMAGETFGVTVLLKLFPQLAPLKRNIRRITLHAEAGKPVEIMVELLNPPADTQADVRSTLARYNLVRKEDV